jgi:hypothetical protein
MHATMGGGIVVNSVLELAISLTSRPTGSLVRAPAKS